jgi:hypothetical protein
MYFGDNRKFGDAASTPLTMVKILLDIFLQ